MTRTNRTVLFAFAAVLCLVLSGCVTRVADLTLVSTKNIDLSDAKLDARQGQRTTGESCAWSILGLIPLGIPNLEEAVDDALEKGAGNVMVDQVTYYKGYYFVLAGKACIEAEGTVLQAAKR